MGPDFFILGAAKSGTTSLYHALRQHPQVFMSAEKEPNFFCGPPRRVETVDGYRSLFHGAAPGQARGEASHAYLTWPTSARQIAEHFPRSKFILVLRDPADRAYSLYRHLVRAGLESVVPFEAALLAEDRRFRDATFRHHCPHYLYNFLYLRSGLYGRQIERYLRVFERDRFLFLRFDELRADPADLFPRVFRFLGIDPAFSPQLGVRNPGRSIRSARLQVFLRQRIRDPLRRYRVPVIPNLARLAMKLNESRRAAPPLSPETRRDLMARCAADLARAARLTGLDLSAWNVNRTSRLESTPDREPVRGV